MDPRDTSLVIKKRIIAGERRRRLILALSIFILLAIFIVIAYLSNLFIF